MEVRSGIALANQKASESLGALQQAALLPAGGGAAVELTRVTEGSSQADVDEANGQLQQAVQNISEVQQLVRSAISTAEGVSQRLSRSAAVTESLGEIRAALEEVCRLPFHGLPVCQHRPGSGSPKRSRC